MANLLACAGAGGGRAAASSLLTGLQAYWKLDEASGARNDATANGNNLTSTNSVGQGAGVLGNAASFVAASNQYLSISDGLQTGLNPGTTAFTFACWVNVNSLSASMTIVSKGAGGGAQAGYELEVLTDGSLFLRFCDGSASRLQGGSAAGVIAIGTWYFVAVTFDRSGNATVFVNNVAKLTLAISAQPGSVTAAVAFYLGCFGPSTFSMDGRIDEFGFWTALLSGSQLTSLYNAGTPPAYPFTGVP